MSYELLVVITALDQLSTAGVRSLHGLALTIGQNWPVRVIASHLCVLRVLCFTISQTITYNQYYSSDCVPIKTDLRLM
jgi:hypothetical protein